MTVTAPTTTAEILREDGAEAALLALAEKVAQAEQAIRQVLRENPTRVWTVRELQDAAAGDLSSSVMSIAYLRLLKAGELQVDHSSSRVEAVAA
jgi:hypothetical protein